MEQNGHPGPIEGMEEKLDAVLWNLLVATGKQDVKPLLAEFELLKQQALKMGMKGMDWWAKQAADITKTFPKEWLD